MSKKAKITVRICKEVEFTETMFGTKREVESYASRLLERLVMTYCKERKISDPSEMIPIYNNSGYTIEWLEETSCVYVVNESYPAITTVHQSRADAEEFVFSLCEDWVYELMTNADAGEVFGKDDWDWHTDWLYLMVDCARDCEIRESYLFD